MTEFVTLLRGVNVGGINIKMADLAEAIRAIGYDEVTTVLASGNVLFTSSDSAADAKSKLEAALSERFGYEAWVHVMTVAALRKIIAGYPFERARDGWHDYVIVVIDGDSRRELEAVAATLDPAEESAASGSGVLYWTVKKGNTLDSVLGKAQGKAKHKKWLTTRNLNTLEKLVR